MRVLLAEDEVTIVVTLQDALEEAGHAVLHAPDTSTALQILEEQSPEAVITDIRMPGAGGMAVLARSVELDPERPVIVITGYATVEQAVEAMRVGAEDYVQKPFPNEALVQKLARLAGKLELRAENESLRGEMEALRAELRSRRSFDDFVGTSAGMQEVFERIRTVAPTDATVLIMGQSGTGKECVARALHSASERSEGPFIALSCAALPESLLEAELFGFEKGAFTDARRDRRGRFELADGGTLFLDDIDDMPLAVQVKLLRVLQERRFERLGSETTLGVDIRVVAAAKVPLRERVREGLFREDLFYRINVVPIELPPLKDRRGDVPLLVQHMIERHGGERDIRLSASTLAALERYPWPGNVRELENAVQRAIALMGSSRELALEHMLPLDSRWRGATQVPDEVLPLRRVLKEAELAHIRRALEQTGGHRSQTAELLGISRKVLWEKMREHGVEAPGGEGG